MNENYPLPPPTPPMKKTSYGRKVFFIGLISFVLMFGVLAVWLMLDYREIQSNEVSRSITRQWGEEVRISGMTWEDSVDVMDVYPEIYDCLVEVETKSLHRGIYEAEVFTAKVNVSGTYINDSIFDSNEYRLTIYDPQGQIIDAGRLKLGDREFKWEKTDDGLFAIVNLDGITGDIGFTTEFTVKGSGGIFIYPEGEKSTIVVNGNAKNPSFDGRSLPLERETGHGRFSAKWEDRFGSVEREYVGVSFLTGVNNYLKVVRSLKYSFIIIVLTFSSVLLVEIIRKQPIPLLNYFLIGGALILFYSLLLSFTEIVPFGWAYLISTLMTVGLISLYMWRMLSSRTTGVVIGVLLLMMYSVCYILLGMSTFTLLVGSLVLFVVLGAMMYASLRI